MELHRVYRDYIQHEDGLINNRVGWFIQLHSFLIASYGIVIAALVGSFFPERVPDRIGLWEPQLVCCLLLVGIGLIGLESSESARKSIQAANDAIAQLKEQWLGLPLPSDARDELPPLTGGGSEAAESEGAWFHLKLPIKLRMLWIASFLIPGAFALIAARAAIPPEIWAAIRIAF